MFAAYKVRELFDKVGRKFVKHTMLEQGLQVARHVALDAADECGGVEERGVGKDVGRVRDGYALLDDARAEKDKTVEQELVL